MYFIDIHTYMSMCMAGVCTHSSAPLKRCHLWSYNTTQITLYSASTIKYSCALLFSKILSGESY